MALSEVREAADAWEWARTILRDHRVPLCHHRPTQATLWALMADLTAHQIAYSQGAPCRNPFVEWAWPSVRPEGIEDNTQGAAVVRDGWHPA